MRQDLRCSKGPHRRRRRLRDCLPQYELVIDQNNLKGRTSTYHKLLALPVGKLISTWEPDSLGHKLDRLPRVILRDEAGMVPTEIFQAVDPYLER